MNHIAANVHTIQTRIREAALRAGRDPAAVRLIAITKSVGLADIEALWQAGVREMGENRVDRIPAVLAQAPAGIQWHMIAPLQTRKAGEIVAHFAYFDALDRLRAAEALQRRCEELQKTLKILVEVNVTGETSKHGLTRQELPGYLREMTAFDRLDVTGLMTMAPFDAPESVVRPCFRTLRALADEAGLPECSMGMTDDFEIAIEEGSTQVRVGRALFEAPPRI